MIPKLGRNRLATFQAILPWLDRILDTGLTYFIQGEDGGPIKIGFTTNHPKERLSELQVGSPVRLCFVGFMKGRRELELHRRFAHLRLHGEWFDNDLELCEFILENNAMRRSHGSTDID